MDIVIRNMEKADWKSIEDIYTQGIRTKKATFQTKSSSYEEWDQGHIKECRLVAVNNESKVVGWIALSPTSSRCVYRGVAEVSIYIDEDCRGKDIGSNLMKKLIEESENNGIWTLQSGILEINEASIALHTKCGFRIVGIREKIACDSNGVWQNTILMEKRSQTVGI